jgi:hypothetical protein
MFDSKFYTTMVSLVVAVVLICNYNPKKEEIMEKWTSNIGTRLSRSTIIKPQNGIESGKNLQANPSPRFTNVSLPATLNHSLASGGCSHLANCGSNSLSAALSADKQSVESFTNMVRENYNQKPVDGCAACPSVGNPTFMSEPVMAANYAAGDFNKKEENRFEDTSTLPITGMETLNVLGEDTQVINIDRLMYANKKSRLRQHGDPIRGDLPIVPCKGGWFRPSVNVSTDLMQGALSVMGGFDGEQQKDLTALINTESMGTVGSVAGISLNTISADQGLSTVSVTAFP